MKNGDADWAEHKEACARVTARFGPRWLRGYVASKLRSDPVYPAAYALLRSTGGPVLDVGCGLGLLGFYLKERRFEGAVTGFDVDERKIRRAVAAVSSAESGLRFVQGDVRRPFDFLGNIALFDLLHYLKPDDQRLLLRDIAGCVAPGGVLIIRDCPRDRSLRFRATFLAEKFAQLISWNVTTPLHFPSRESVSTVLGEAGFTGAFEPLWGRTPFNNHLFVFRKDAVGVGQGLE